MLQIIKLFFFILASSALSGQTDTNYTGKTQWNGYLPSSGFYEKGSFIDGKRNGVWVYRDSSGSVVIRKKFKNGQHLRSIYYKNGKIVATHDVQKNKWMKREDCGC